MAFILPPDPDEGPGAQGYGYTECEGYPETDYGRDGIALKTRYQVDYVLAEFFCARLLGTSYYKGDQILTRRLPHKYPPRGGRTGPIYCVSANAKPWPGTKGGVFPGIATNLYTYALVEATYSSLSYIPGTNPAGVVVGGVGATDIGQDGTLYYTSLEFETSAQTLPLPPQTFVFATAKDSHGKPKVLNTQLPYPIPSGTVHMTRHWVPYPSIRPLVPRTHDLDGLIGTTNMFPMLGGFFAVETLEYLGAKSRTVNTPLGNQVAEVTLSIKYYPHGTNNYPIADPEHATGLFDELHCQADPAVRVFKAADWAGLWA